MLQGARLCHHILLAASCCWCLALGSCQGFWGPLHFGTWHNESIDGIKRNLLQEEDSLSNFLEAFGIEDAPEMKPDHSVDKTSFYQRNTDAIIQSHDAHQKARQRQRERHMADRRRYIANVTGAALPAQDREDQEHFLAHNGQPQNNAGGEAEASLFQKERQKPGRSKRSRASVKKRGSKKRVEPSGEEVPDRPCKVFMLDMAALADMAGVPKCNVENFATHPLTQRLLPDPLLVDKSAAKELSQAPPALEWTFPYTKWPHYRSQHAAPWHLKQAITQYGLLTSNISEATVVFVDDYCYLMWAIADLGANGHWWLDRHKQHKSDLTTRQHLLNLYHAMVHETAFMQKQGRNFLFVSPLTSFDFGDWKTMDDYVAMSCEHFSNSMHIVFDQVQRWRCGRYKPERTLVAPLSVLEDPELPPLKLNAERDITAVFRGSCIPDSAKVPQFAGKRLRRYLVKLFSRSGPDASFSCTNEDKTGLGAEELQAHKILPHAEYIQEMRRSKFCIIVPGETQNTPRLTEAFLSGCVPVFVGPPWHAMPFPDIVDYRAAAVTVHVADISRWASFGAKWVLEKNAPRDLSRLHPKWWTPQVSAKYMDEMHSLDSLLEFLREYPEELYTEKQAAVYRLRNFFLWSSQQNSSQMAIDVALQQVCRWGQEESAILHLDI